MKICDAHNDFLTEINGLKNKEKYITKIYKDKNIKYVCCVIWTSKLKNPIKFINKIYNSFFKNNSSKKIILCIEDLGFINKKNYKEIIDLIIKIKPFYCGLVWNYDNELGGGAFGKKGLSTIGKKVVSELEKNDIIIDTAHMNRKTFYNFCKITTKPIFNSHTNLYDCKKHKRNLNSKQIKNIIDSKGLVCLSFVQLFISDKLITTKEIALQMAVFVKKYGSKNIAIGTDFYGTNNLPEDLKSYYDFKNLKKSMKKVGISNKDINNIFHKNFINFKSKINKY